MISVELSEGFLDVQETLRQLNRDHGSSRLYWWSKKYYNKLLPTGNTSPAPRFYGLPKIHKANCPMRPIVSSWTSRKPSDSSTEIMDLPGYIGGAKSITTNCSPQVTHPLHLDSTVYQKSTRLIAPCDP